jgi:LytS/YehU family sensor histidine kinase
VGLTMVLRLSIQWYQREKEKSELQRITSETELKFLKSQINPHFLFNSLNSIYSLTLKKSDDAPQTILKLSEMLRYLLYEASEKKVTIDKEIAYLNNYFELERIRLGNRGKIHFETEIDSDEYLIEPMLIMPFVENCFKHGLNKLANDGWVSVILKIEEGLMNIVISNNMGQNNEEAEKKKVGGIGIENVKRRLKLLYPNKHKLLITNTNNIYKVDLELSII